MSRLGASLLVLAALACGATTVYADTTPSPPPGTVQLQPVSASTGSGSQSAGVSTGQIGAGSDQKGTAAGECGVQATGGGSGYAAQPSQVGTSGTSTPGCSPAGSTSTAKGGQTGAHQSNVTNAKSAGSNDANARKNASAATAVLGPTASMLASQQAPPWLGLIFVLFLLIALCILLGFAIGSRRYAASRGA